MYSMIFTINLNYIMFHDNPAKMIKNKKIKGVNFIIRFIGI